MKLTAKLRLIFKIGQDPHYENTGIYTDVWVDVPQEQLKSRGYGEIEYHEGDNEDGLNLDDFSKLEDFYSYKGNLPANSCKTMNVVGLPDEIKLIDTEWEEEDETGDGSLYLPDIESD